MLLLYKGNGKRENKNKNWGFPKKKKKKAEWALIEYEEEEGMAEGAKKNW